jgi:hypothetical protein
MTAREHRDLTARAGRSRRGDEEGGGLRLTIEPYRQGELDSLCGIYAVINAIYGLCPEMDGDLAETLFRKLIKSLGDHIERPIGPLYDGLPQSAVESLIRVGAQEIRRELEIKLKASAYKPLRKPSLGQLWDDLRSHVHRRQVAILGLSGVEEHWTVAYAVSDKLIRLFDSNEYQVLRRSRCTTSRARKRFQIDPRAVILVKRCK